MSSAERSLRGSAHVERPSIRLYPDPSGGIAGAGASLVLVVISVIVLVLALVGVSVDGTDIIGALISIAFFGFCAAVFVYLTLQERRTSLLEFSEHGIASRYSRWPSPRMPWSAVSEVGIYRGEPIRPTRPPRYYLVALARDPAVLGLAEQVEERVGDDWMYPEVPAAAIALPLEKVYSRTTAPARVDALLARIRDALGPDLLEHGVTLDREIRRLHTPRVAVEE